MLRVVCLFLLSSLALSAQGIEFFSGSWEEALARAETEDKLIFVDAFAEWCGPCKRMAANEFPKAEVGDFYNTNFINVKLDMEKAESTEFRQTHSVSAFPTLFFINGKNEVVHKVVGGKNAGQLVAEARRAVAKLDDLDALTAAYEGGKTDAGTTYRYLRALIRNNESHLRVANDYLRDNAATLGEPDNLRIIYLAATDADSRIFDLLVEHRAAIEALEGKENFAAQVRRAVRTTFDKGLEYKSEDLLEVATKKMALVDEDAADRMTYEAQFELALRGNDTKNFTKAAKNYLKRGAEGDADALRNAFTTIGKSSFVKDEKVLELAIEAGTAAAELSEEGWRDYYNLARFLQVQDRPGEALKAAERSLAGVADGPANYRRAVQDLVDKLREATK